MICGCAGISRPARSRSCSPTSRARRAAGRARRRGLRGGARGAPADRARGVRAAGRSRGGHAGRCVLRRLPDRAGRARGSRGRSSTELGAGPIRVRIGVHTGTPLLTEEGYVGADVHRAARIAASGHGGQVLVSSSTSGAARRRLAASTSESIASRISPRAERVFQLGERRLPSAPEPLPDEPPGAGDAVPRPRARARRGRRAPRARRRPAPDADRAGRDREDAARAPGRCRGVGRVSGRHLVGRARAAAGRPAARHVAGAGAHGRGASRSGPRRARRRAPRGKRALLLARQRGAPASRGRDGDRTPSRRRGSDDPRHEPRAAPAPG